MINSGAKVSLLVPLYNSSRYLDKLASDIRAQTRRFDEVLMYDDCSSDDSAQKAESYGFTVFRGSACRRQSHARNFLLKRTSGDFVHFHDHDDPIHPRFVERTLSIATRNRVVITPFNQISPKETTRHDFSDLSPNRRFDLIFLRYVHLNAMLSCRELAQRSSGFDESLTLFEEKDFLCKLLKLTSDVAILSDVLAEWTVQDTSFMSKQGWVGAAAMLRKFINNCASDCLPEAQKGMLEYCLRTAWNYYYADPNTIRDLVLMFGDLKKAGYRPTKGLGKKMELICSALGPTSALRLRRIVALGIKSRHRGHHSSR